MREIYKIKDVLHSGRKGVRRTQLKANILADNEIVWDINTVKRFEQTEFYMISTHDCYDTSAVIQLYKRMDGTYELETVDLIYVLEEIA